MSSWGPAVQSPELSRLHAVLCALVSRWPENAFAGSARLPLQADAQGRRRSIILAALTASRRANSTALRASAAGNGAGSYWAGVLNRSSWNSWRAAYRPSSPAVASRLRASACSPPARWPTRAPVMASHALIPAVTALPAATSHLQASRLSTARFEPRLRSGPVGPGVTWGDGVADVTAWGHRSPPRRSSSCDPTSTMASRRTARQNSRPSLAFGPALRRSSSRS